MPKETLIAIGAGVLSAISATAFLSRAPGQFALFLGRNGSDAAGHDLAALRGEAGQ